MKPWRTAQILVEIPVREHTDTDLVWAVADALQQGRRLELDLRPHGPIGRVRVKSLTRYLQGKAKHDTNP